MTQKKKRIIALAFVAVTLFALFKALEESQPKGQSEEPKMIYVKGTSPEFDYPTVRYSSRGQMKVTVDGTRKTYRIDEDNIPRLQGQVSKDTLAFKVDNNNQAYPN